MSESNKDINEIPTVKLTNYSFSPPGPMGWSSTEYTTMLEDPKAFLSAYKIKHPEPRMDNVTLIELPVKNRRQLEIDLSKKSVAAAEKIPPLEAAPIMMTEPAIEIENFDYEYEKLMNHLLDADQQESDIFIGTGKRKSRTYASNRLNRVIFF